MRLLAALLVALTLPLAGCTDPDEGDGDGDGTGDIMPAFELVSTAFADGSALPRKHTCDGASVSPPLTILGTPNGTKSLLLLVKDPDVPTPQAPVRTIQHWTVANITPGAQVNFPEGGVPAGADDRGSEFGPGYRGPCPPQGSPAHRYNFTVHALDVAGIAIPDNATAAQVEAAIAGHTIGRGATLVGTYARPLAASTSTSTGISLTGSSSSSSTGP